VPKLCYLVHEGNLENKGWAGLAKRNQVQPNLPAMVAGIRIYRGGAGGVRETGVACSLVGRPQSERVSSTEKV
jgi:hypothetical protein